MVYVNTGKDGNYVAPADDDPSQVSDEPSQISQSSDTSKVSPGGDDNIKTGDGTNATVAFVLVLISGVAVAAIFMSKKSRKTR